MQAFQVMRILVALAVLAGLGSAADAQVARSGGSSSQAVQQLQQLAQERTALQAENARLKKDLDGAQADLKRLHVEHDALKARVGGAESAAARVKAASEATEHAAETARQKLEELVGRFREVAQTLRDTETDRAVLRQRLDEKSRAFDQCAKVNVEMHDIAIEALSRYERSATRGKEVLTGISRVRIENLVDDYRQRVEELKLAAPAGPTAGPPVAR